MLTSIPWSDVPAMAGNQLYLDYLGGRGPASGFFSHGPLDFAEALEQRRGLPSHRRQMADLITQYNRDLGAGDRTIAAAHSLAQPDTYCVICGQQATMLGGPVMTTYKIATVIRLAAQLESALGVHVVPVFWLASEDHDFDEVNHLYYVKGDGEAGRVRFRWSGVGRPIADMPVTAESVAAYDEYFGRLQGGPLQDWLPKAFAPDGALDYSTWQAMIFARFFAREGLVLVEPRVLRPLCGGFFAEALRHEQGIRDGLRAAGEALRLAGYRPGLDPESYGRLYTLDDVGHRVRVDDASAHVDVAAGHPERYSTDAALRPLLADSLLPVLADVLGAGEIAYQAMLLPLHGLLGVPQPVLFPRKHYTVLASGEARRLARYGVSAADILSERMETGAVFARLFAEAEGELFDRARAGVASALAPLRSYVGCIDPGLGRTWEGTVARATQSVTKLQERSARARLGQLGYTRHELQTLRNLVLPRGRLQERVLPLPHFLAEHGPTFLDSVLEAGPLDSFAHHVLTLEDPYGGS